MTLETLELVYRVPEFVKTASAASLDPNQPGAIVVGGYRIDNKAAAWFSSAVLRKQAMDNPVYVPEHRVDMMVKQACSLYGVSDDMFILHPAKFDEVLVKEAGENARFTIGDESDYIESARAVIKKRASAPYLFCKKCAESLLNLGEKNGYTLPADVHETMTKMAGIGNVDYDRGVFEINRRYNYALNSGRKDYASVLKKFASTMAEHPNTDVVSVIIAGMDEFDRGMELFRKEASSMTYPELSIFQNGDEYVKSLANQRMYISSDLSISRGSLMKQASVDCVCGWIKDCGYSVPSNPTPEEIINTVRTMPRSLQEEFATCEQL